LKARNSNTAKERQQQLQQQQHQQQPAKTNQQQRPKQQQPADQSQRPLFLFCTEKKYNKWVLNKKVNNTLKVPTQYSKTMFVKNIVSLIDSLLYSEILF